MKPIHHQTLRRLTYFAAIAEAGSIRGAAERLGLSVPVISEALADLEAELDVTLARRTTRQFALTEAGRAVETVAADIQRLAQGLQDQTSADQPLRGLLAITLPVELATHWLAPHLAAFRANHPDVTFRIEASDHVADLKHSPFDLAIRTAYLRPGHDPGGKSTLPLTCVIRAPTRCVRSDATITLPDSTLIGPRPDRGLIARAPHTEEELRIYAAATLAVDNRGVATALALQGLGTTLVVAASVQDTLATGQLVPLLPGYDFGAITLEPVFRDPLPSRAARAFVASLNHYT